MAGDYDGSSPTADERRVEGHENMLTRYGRVLDMHDDIVEPGRAIIIGLRAGDPVDPDDVRTKLFAHDRLSNQQFPWKSA